MAAYVYEPPFYSSSKQPLVKLLLTGWQLSGVTTLQSGIPINVTISVDRANVGTGSQRPDVVGNPRADCGAHKLLF